MTWSGYSEKGQGSQERGPGSFANQAPGPVQGNASQAAGSGEVRSGVRFIGRGTTELGRVAAGDPSMPKPVTVKDETLSVLMKLGEQTLAPRIAEIKAQAEINGAARHASGVALEEIINEQPWYAGVFGTAPAVEGARTYASRAATARFVQANMENMEQLGQQSPDAFVPMLSDQIKQHMTGDAATDAIIKRELIGQLPTLIKAQTKAHVAYMQQKADAASYAAMRDTAAEYGTLMSQHNWLTDEDKQRATDKLAETFMLPAGRNPASHWKNMTNVLIDQANQGNSHFLAAANRAGIIAAIPDDYRDVVKMGLAKAAPGIFDKVASSDTDFLTAAAALDTNPPDTPEEIAAEWTRINAIMAERTGIPVDLVRYRGVSTLERSIELDQRRDLQAARDNETAVQASMRKQQEALQKQQDHEATVSKVHYALTQAFNDPRVNVQVATKGAANVFGATKEQEEEAWRRAMNGLDAPGVGRLLARSPTSSNAVIKERLDTWWSAANRPEEQAAMLGAWGQLVAMSSAVPSDIKGEALLGTHMGQEEAASVKAVQRLTASGVDMLTAVTMVTQEAPMRKAAAKWRAQADDDKQAAARDMVGEVVDSTLSTSSAFRTWRTALGGRKVDQYQIDALSGMLANMDTGLLSTPQASMQVALNSLVSDGYVTVAGGGVTRNWDQQDAQRWSLSEAIGFNGKAQEDAAHEALYVVAEERLRAQGYGMTRSTMGHINDVARRITSPLAGGALNDLIPKDTGFEASGYSVIRLPRDKADKRIAYAVTYEHNGVPKQIIVSSDDVKRKYDEIVGFSRLPQVPRGMELGDDPATQNILQQNLK